MITLAIVDDEQLIASSLATLLDLEDDLKVTETFASGEEVISRWKKASILDSPLPDVLVTDLQLGGIDGVDLAQEISQLSPQTAIVIVTSHSRPHQLKRALTSGVQGFLPKTATAEEFATAIRTVHEGKSFIDQELAAMTITANSSPLTEREAEVIEAAGKGGVDRTNCQGDLPSHRHNQKLSFFGNGKARCAEPVRSIFARSRIRVDLTLQSQSLPTKPFLSSWSLNRYLIRSFSGLASMAAY